MSEIDRDFVVDQLENTVSKTKLLQDDIKILCPFHPDSDPSCMVNLSGHKVPIGTFHCWSCGAKGPWSKLASELGLESGALYHSENPFAAKGKAMRRKEQEHKRLKESLFAKHLPVGCVPWKHGSFRELSEEFLTKIDARRYYDDKSECYRVVFPVRGRDGMIIGSVARRVDKAKNYRWLNEPGPWVTKALYPIDLIDESTTTIALTEGPYDALRLLYHGIPALSILGTQNWSKQKVSMLNAQGITKVIIAMDGDKPGRIATVNIFDDLDGKFKRKRFLLPFEDPALDPGNMDQEKIELLKELFTQRHR